MSHRPHESCRDAISHVNGWSLPLRFAMRELRGGLRGFYVLIFCIGLGVMAIAGVGSLAESLVGGLAREGRTILGGDVSFALFHREANAEERALLARYGKVSDAATLRAMARASGSRQALVEVKAVDGAYPLYGTPVLEPAMPLSDALATRDGVFGAAVDIALLTRLDLKVGDRIDVGNAPIEIRAVLRSEPDKLAGGIGFGPRLLVSIDALRATGLLQPGSLVRWLYRVALNSNDATDSAVKTLVADAEKQLPDAGWEIRSRDNASPQLERNIERFTQFLTLVGLTALLVGGVGVANAVRSHLERRRDTIATMKSLGATGGRIFAIYLVQVMTIAAIGTAGGTGGRRRLAVRDRMGLRRHPAAAGRTRAAMDATRARCDVRITDGACLRAVAARPRARHPGLGAVSRSRQRPMEPAAQVLSVRRHGGDTDTGRALDPARL